MTVLTLSDDQVRLIAGASTPVVVVNTQGKEVGKFHPVAPATQSLPVDDEWAEAIRQRDQYRKDGGNGFTTKEVLDYLRSLTPEWPAIR